MFTYGLLVGNDVVGTRPRQREISTHPDLAVNFPSELGRIDFRDNLTVKHVLPNRLLPLLFLLFPELRGMGSYWHGLHSNRLWLS